ncbi:hypothetical protein [Nonomuraea sediminis]|uniref:hypothetical protein n=1 Tax=Nonomuraea sediminis TaxID=2835864 RepID=UPI001BDBB8B4|nr:hypothetical protein [Nonomuraea sediminis]
MTLTPEKKDDAWYATGLTRAGTDSTRLGTWLKRVGPHWVAFDDAFDVPVMRAVYDPAFAPRGLKEYLHVGYVQLAEILFRGVPIPPWVFDPRLADRRPYVVNDKTLRFVDMMGPADLRAIGAMDPFYAFNGSLRDLFLAVNDFYQHPQPNGSLLRKKASPKSTTPPPGPETPPDNESRYATIVADVCGELLTPDDLKLMIGDDEPYASVTSVVGEEPYKTVIRELLTETEPAGDDDVEMPVPGEAETDSIPPGQFVVRAIGGYVLIELPDSEDFRPTYVVPPALWQSMSYDIPVYRISPFDVESTRSRLVADLFGRIAAYQIATKQAKDLVLKAPPGRGNGGYDRPLYALEFEEFAIEIAYTTILCGKPVKETRGSHLTAIAAFRWGALMQYDPARRALELTAVRTPAETVTLSMDDIGQRMTDLVTKPETKDMKVDTSYFTMAAVRRDGYPAYRTLRYLPSDAKNATVDEVDEYTPEESP